MSQDVSSVRRRVLREGAWGLAALPILIGLVVLVCANPAIGLGVMAGVAAIGLGFSRPKTFFALGMLLLLMQRTIALHVNTPAIDYIDEGFVLAAFVIFGLRRLVRREGFRKLPGQLPLVLFLLVGVVSSLANAVPFDISAQGALLIGKGFFLAWAVAQLDWTLNDLRRAAKIGAWVAIVLIVGAAVNFAAPGPWTSIILAGQGYGTRFGLSPVTSFFQHPGYFGSVMALACLAAISHLSVFGRTKTALFIVAGSVAAAVLTARRKILVGLIAAIGVLGIRLRWAPLAIIIVVGTPLAAILLWDTIATIAAFTYAEYFVNPDAVARVRLTTDSVDLAMQSFPAGVGFGRFGSAVARSNYSPLYYELGYPTVWGLGPTEENGQFLTDTFWPAIIGETGFIGSVLLVIVLAIYLRRFVLLSRHDGGWDRWLGLIGIGWSVQLFVESLAGAIYTAVPTFALFFALIGIAATRPMPKPAPLSRGRAPRRGRTRVHR